MRNLALAAALAFSLAACGASDQGGTDSSQPGAADRGQQMQAQPKQGSGGSGGKGSGDGAGLTQVPIGRATIRTSAVTVRVDDVAAAARAAVRTAEGTGGYLESEETKDDRTTLTLRVPPEDFTKTYDALAALGTVTDRTVSTEDVTGDVADVEGRLKAARASVNRVRELLRRAQTIAEITNLEGELNEREADLESLESRRRALAGKTGYASLTATFTKPVLAAAPAAEAPKTPEGFGDGLSAGWDVFTKTVTVLLIVLGALLPFAVAAALVGVPLYVVRRRKFSARA